MSLLSKAKEVVPGKRDINYSKEELELVEAWLNDEVTLKQVSAVLDKNSTSPYVFLCLGARELWRRK